MTPSSTVAVQTWFEDQVDVFERAWNKKPAPDLRAFFESLTPPNHQLGKQLLLELVKLDLEYRWSSGKQTATHAGPKLEFYFKKFPELGDWDDLPLELAGEEYYVRHRFGDQPTHAEFHARFSRHGSAMVRTLEAIDRQLEREYEVESISREHSVTEFDPAAPLTIADFQLLRQIGSGGMCRVYTARQRSLDKPVAIKILKKSNLGDPRSVRRFLNEARTAASLRHPNIVGVHGVGRLPAGGYFMVMDLVQGQDLAHTFTNEAVPDARQVADIMQSAAKTVQHVHQQGILHCDLTPGNILLDADSNVLLSDFGFARKLGGKPEDTDWGDAGGTIAYMAPEQVDSQFGTLGRWTDVYGLGGVLYSLLLGRVPIRADTIEEARSLHDAAAEIQIPLEQLDEPYLPLAEVCAVSLRKDPHGRFASAEQMADAVRNS